MVRKARTKRGKKGENVHTTKTEIYLLIKKKKKKKKKNRREDYGKGWGAVTHPGHTAKRKAGLGNVKRSARPLGAVYKIDREVGLIASIRKVPSQCASDAPEVN